MTDFTFHFRSVGVRSIREYETKILAKRTQRAEEMGRLSTQLSKLKSKLEYELAKDKVSLTDKSKKELSQLQGALNDATEKEEEQK